MANTDSEGGANANFRQPDIKSETSDIKSEIPVNKSTTPVLDNFGRDITKLAAEGRLDTVIGRDSEMESIIQILGRRKKNIPILIGESGVGKSAIIDKLATLIVRKKITRSFFNKRVIIFDIESLISNSVYDDRKKMKEVINAIIHELNNTKNIILILENINLFLSNSKSALADAFSLLKTALTQSQIQCIATLSSENLYFFEKDISFERIFQKVKIKPNSKEETKYILQSIYSKYEDYHNVTYEPESIIACIELSEQFINNRFFPDKAIDVLDQVGAIVSMKNRHVPRHIEELEKRIEVLKEDKNYAVKNQQYEKAADLRDLETRLSRQLEQEVMQWEDESKFMRYPVFEHDVYELFEKNLFFNEENEDVIDSNSQDEEVNYLKDKIMEYDLENKASFKIQGIPNELKTSFQQYILYFKDYLEKVKDKSIFFEVSKIEDGLRIDINPTEIVDFEEFNDWFNEYMNFIRKKSKDFNVIFDTFKR